MQGSVYVEYTGIGGTNIDMGIMPADLSGSTDGGNTEVGGDDTLHITITWNLPGGMVDKGNTYPEGAAWGYIIGREYQGGIPYGDQQFTEYLSNTCGYKFDETFNLVDESQAPFVENKINELCYSYVKRVINGDGFSEDYNWGAMNRFYSNCFLK